MSKKKNKFIPELRFPEFKNEGEWEYVYGDELFEPISNKDHDSDLPILAITQEQGAVPRDMINYHVSVTEKSIESYKVVEIGDFIISLRSFQGGIEYSNYLGLCSPAYIVLRKKEDVINDFYRHYFKSYPFIQDLNKNLEGIRDGKMISYKQFSEILIPKPKIKEQVKIAACLSSLDEVISAYNEKLELLKDHKKGLMQNLFPQVGEKVPKYRFPEFVNNGEWLEKDLGEIAKLITIKNKDNVVTRVLTNSAANGIVDQRDFFDREIVTESNLEGYYIVENGDFVYNPRISTVAPVGPISVNKTGIGVMSPLYTVFRFNTDNIDFFEQYFKTDLWYSSLRSISNSGARHDRMNISLNAFFHLPLLSPNSEEQQKIVSCLSALDELILAQAEKLELLKQHKIGLIQDLFPKMIE
ncbi:MAG: restriction endonuclease subunit S [Bacteroidia bacterium]|nr:restriction endonuclease subunit S [Bacteroidia bacterium]